MTDYTEFEDFLWEWACEKANPELSEIFECTQHQEFFEVDCGEFVEV